MLLDELITVIETLKQRITDHGAILQDNETRTRMALIDPLLQVLGWDTTVPFLGGITYLSSQQFFARTFASIACLGEGGAQAGRYLGRI